MLNGLQRYAEWTEHPDVDDIDLMRLAVMDTNTSRNMFIMQ